MKDLCGKECKMKGSPEQEAKKGDAQKLEETLNFFKIAFAVDGDVRLLSTKEKFIIKGIIEFNDSKRGKFHIGIMGGPRINNNELAWNIYKKLEESGAGIGNSSVMIIEKELNDNLVGKQ